MKATESLKSKIALLNSEACGCVKTSATFDAGDYTGFWESF